MGKRIYQSSPEKNEARKKQQAEWKRKKKEEEKSLAERQKEVEAAAAALEKSEKLRKSRAKKASQESLSQTTPNEKGKKSKGRGRTTKNKKTPPAVTVGPKKTPRKVTPDAEIGQATAPANNSDSKSKFSTSISLSQVQEKVESSKITDKATCPEIGRGPTLASSQIQGTIVKSKSKDTSSTKYSYLLFYRDNNAPLPTRALPEGYGSRDTRSAHLYPHRYNYNSSASQHEERLRC